MFWGEVRMVLCVNFDVDDVNWIMWNVLFGCRVFRVVCMNFLDVFKGNLFIDLEVFIMKMILWGVILVDVGNFGGVISMLKKLLCLFMWVNIFVWMFCFFNLNCKIKFLLGMVCFLDSVICFLWVDLFVGYILMLWDVLYMFVIFIFLWIIVWNLKWLGLMDLGIVNLKIFG